MSGPMWRCSQVVAALEHVRVQRMIARVVDEAKGGAALEHLGVLGVMAMVIGRTNF